MSIKVNKDARTNLISSKVNDIVKECQEAADKGHNSIYCTVDKDIQRDVRNALDKEHDIYVPHMVYCGVNARPSHLQIEHYGDTLEMKLKWRS